MTKDQTPFADLPAALVEEVLGQSAAVADGLLSDFLNVRKDRETRRKQLIESGIVISESVLGYPPLPTTCGTDGSYAIERLLTTDLVAAAAVAVEGLTPPSEKRFWGQPRHSTFIAAEPHLEDISTVLRAVMLGEELCLAVGAPHDLVMVDGTLTLPIIYFNQALNKAPETSQLQCSKRFLENCLIYLDAYRKILTSERSDKQYVALPKYSTRREIGSALGWPEGYDDRGMLTMILNPGELTKPQKMEQPKQAWHLYTRNLPDSLPEQAGELANEIVKFLGHAQIFYYKP